MWTANPQQFVEDEDDDTFSYSVRISAQDLLLVRTLEHFVQVLDGPKFSVISKTFLICQAVAAEFQNESAAALAAAATRHLLEAEQAKNAGSEHW